MLDHDTLRELADLACLQIPDREHASLCRELGALVEHLAVLDAPAPAAATEPPPCPMRPDLPEPPLPPSTVLALAPDPAPPYVGVPPFLKPT